MIADHSPAGCWAPPPQSKVRLRVPDYYKEIQHVLNAIAELCAP
jgi:hypothetical protein